MAGWAGRVQTQIDARDGLVGHALAGALLGVVWAPCVGPTPGATVALATAGQNLGSALLVMVAFGHGIATVLLLIALVARGVLDRWRGRLMEAGGNGKFVLGVLLLLVGISILIGWDRQLDAFALDHLPKWMTRWSTRLLSRSQPLQARWHMFAAMAAASTAAWHALLSAK